MILREVNIIKNRVNKKAAVTAASALICAFLFCTAPFLRCQAKIVTYYNGDADGDNNITIMDVTTIQRVLKNLCDDADGFIGVRADIDRNGLNLSDAIAVQHYLAGFEDPHKIGSETNWIVKSDNELPEIEA